MSTSARTTLARTEENAPTPKEVTAVPVLLDTKERTATKVRIVQWPFFPLGHHVMAISLDLTSQVWIDNCKELEPHSPFPTSQQLWRFFFVRCEWMSEQSLPERRTVHEHEGKLQLFLCCWIRREELRQRYGCSCQLVVFVWGYRDLLMLATLFLTDVDECQRDPCQNGGQCTNSKGSYSCSCAAGYEGKNCDKGACALARALVVQPGCFHDAMSIMGLKSTFKYS